MYQGFMVYLAKLTNLCKYPYFYVFEAKNGEKMGKNLDDFYSPNQGIYVTKNSPTNRVICREFFVSN